MRIRFEHDGQPEAHDFDDNYVRVAPPVPAPAHVWRDLRLTRAECAQMDRIVRLFRWETPAAARVRR